jgi:hypothetical protein
MRKTSSHNLASPHLGVSASDFFRQSACSLAVIVLLATAGCGYKTPPTEAERPPAFDPQQFTGGQIYTISGEDSEIRINVYRGGTLAKMGHNHVIATRDIRGNIYHHPELRRSGIIVYLPVNSFEVDNKEHRQAAGAGFEILPPEKDIQGTRGNMLGEQLLYGENYPDIELTSVEINGDMPQPDILLRITVRDNSRDIRIPANVKLDDNKLMIDGHTRLRQSDLGLTPFSILMGAIAVQDEMDVEFHIIAVVED